LPNGNSQYVQKYYVPEHDEDSLIHRMAKVKWIYLTYIHPLHKISFLFKLVRLGDCLAAGSLPKSMTAKATTGKQGQFCDKPWMADCSRTGVMPRPPSAVLPEEVDTLDDALDNN
jgi:hypothetical protein